MRPRNDAMRQGASLKRAAREHLDGGHAGLREVGVLGADREQHEVLTALVQSRVKGVALWACGRVAHSLRA